MTTGSNPQRRPDGAAFVIALILAGIAVVIFWQTSIMRLPAHQARVGPQVFPYAIAGGLLLLAIGTAVSAWRGSFPARPRENYGPALWIVGGLLGQILLVSSLGFSLASGVLVACTAKAFGRGPMWFTFLCGAVFAFIVWFIFARGLQLSLPAGPLERLIP
ncbi:C4-dicarboxylate ABC transporter [Devosia sp. Root436]|jgi:putative tricarboxylic transport membrane protein|uniref:tripartite tricarboxylate transporter TctB family protein n=1 Tax=Devosia sp. Root436 TaxID=1736537 RepID=UPI0006FDB411|nr:tripartite tricarboxylate transporter TctB family protein [Devosia sp. Root436]KQX35363.1 C4-dicarboxylate ABC transporter [Devosia sp. Root436]